MPWSGTAYDPDTLAMLYRALDEALHRAIPTSTPWTRLRGSPSGKSSLSRAYEDGERDPELLAIIAVQSFQRGS
jgi:hypothetical protein